MAKAFCRKEQWMNTSLIESLRKRIPTGIFCASSGIASRIRAQLLGSLKESRNRRGTARRVRLICFSCKLNPSVFITGRSLGNPLQTKNLNLEGSQSPIQVIVTSQWNASPHLIYYWVVYLWLSINDPTLTRCEMLILVRPRIVPLQYFGYWHFMWHGRACCRSITPFPGIVNIHEPFHACRPKFRSYLRYLE